jgi:hypothetical protein
LKAVKSSADSLSYKIDAIKYDLELIKGDIIRQKDVQKDYFMKTDKIEKRIDSLPGTSPNFYASQNFMTNQTMAAKHPEDNNILGGLRNDRSESKKSGSTQEPPGPGVFSGQRPVQGKPSENFDFMKELDDEFSIIDGNGKNGRTY